MRIKDIESIAHRREPSLQEVKIYKGIHGWLMCHLFRKAHEGQAENRTVYLNKKSLVRNLCKMQASKLDQSKIKNNDIIQRRVIEILIPVLGKPVQIKHVNNLFKEFRTLGNLQDLAKSANSAEFVDKANASLETIKLKLHQRVIKAYNPEELQKVLEPGDIIFRKIPENMDNNIVTAQKFQQMILSGFREREAYKFSHAAIYLGEDEDGMGRIAEAAWPSGKKDEVRSLRLDDPRFALEAGDGREYWVAKPVDRELGKRAAAKAVSIVKKLALEKNTELHEQKTIFRYTIFGAAKSLVHSSRFDFVAKHRYFKQYHDHVHGDLPRGFISKERFFCSYLIGYCYQAAEAEQILPGILGKDDKPIRGRTKFGKALFREIWARAKRWKHFGELNKQVKLKYDAKMTSPQDFRNFVVSKNKLFEDVFVIQAPKKKV